MVCQTGILPRSVCQWQRQANEFFLKEKSVRNTIKIMSTTLWWIHCMENHYPGLWQKWFKLQCVTDGHPPQQGYHIDREDTDRAKRDQGWPTTKNALNTIKPGHKIVAGLPGNRIGRIGEVFLNDTAKDKWKPLYLADRADPKYKIWSEGYMGRKILVRWDLEHGPESPDLVVQLPKGFALGQGELHQVHCKKVEKFEKIMTDQANWVGLVSSFGYESALSDYIALYPHKLEDGLEPYPNERIREKILKGGKRLDVLLRDKVGKPVIVECKQGYPTVENIGQLRGYMTKKIGEPARGILVHGGAGRVDPEVLHEAKKFHINLIRYRLDVDFAPSC